MKLETTRLWLRPYLETDVEDAVRVLGDAQTMSFYARPYSTDEVLALIRKSMETYRLHRFGLFAVVERSTGDYVGDCGITIQEVDGRNEHEVGYRIGRRHWGQGYAVEAGQAVVKYGFEALGLNRLCSYMASDHHQSRRVAEKLGMVLEKQYHNARNRGYLTCVYAISRDDHQRK
jgi:RimJ/RimL family protein N-acetyltransferase